MGLPVRDTGGPGGGGIACPARDMGGPGGRNGPPGPTGRGRWGASMGPTVRGRSVTAGVSATSAGRSGRARSFDEMTRPVIGGGGGCGGALKSPPVSPAGTDVVTDSTLGASTDAAIVSLDTRSTAGGATSVTSTSVDSAAGATLAGAFLAAAFLTGFSGFGSSGC